MYMYVCIYIYILCSMVMEGLRRVLIVVDSKNGLTSFVTREPPAAVPQTSWHAMYNGGIGSFSKPMVLERACARRVEISRNVHQRSIEKLTIDFRTICQPTVELRRDLQPRYVVKSGSQRIEHGSKIQSSQPPTAMSLHQHPSMLRYVQALRTHVV